MERSSPRAAIVDRTAHAFQRGKFDVTHQPMHPPVQGAYTMSNIAEKVNNPAIVLRTGFASLDTGYTG